jgi:hypothetical protein
MYGCIDEFFYTGVAGIIPPTSGATNDGYSDVVIKPYVPKGMKYASAWMETDRGRIHSEWEITHKGLSIQIGIPPNCTGQLNLSVSRIGRNIYDVRESGQQLFKQGIFNGEVPGVKIAREQDGTIELFLDSGEYSFICEYAEVII